MMLDKTTIQSLLEKFQDVLMKTSAHFYCLILKK